MIAKVTNILILLFLVTLLITFFVRYNFHLVWDIDPRTMVDPLQTQTSAKPIEYNGSVITPLYEYDISGLVVAKYDNRVKKEDRFDQLSPYDFCMLWGRNMTNGSHKERDVKFELGNYVCWTHPGDSGKLLVRDISNNHLVVIDEKIEKKLKEAKVSDQVRIVGKLVEVKGPGGSRGSSITRDDKGYSGGQGSCEQILVQDVTILKKGNMLSRNLFLISLFCLAAILVGKIIRFVWTSYQLSRKKASS